MSVQTLNIQYEGENVTIEIVPTQHDIRYKVNFEHPIYLKKDIDDDGLEFWMEEGAGQTLRARELGEEIDKHPDLM